MKAGDRLIQELAGVSFAPATASKRFVRDMAAHDPDYELSERAEAFAWRIAYHHRRQLPKDLADEAVARKKDHIYIPGSKSKHGRVMECSICGAPMFSKREQNAPCPGPRLPKPERKRDTKRKECSGESGCESGCGR